MQGKLNLIYYTKCSGLNIQKKDKVSGTLAFFNCDYHYP